MFHEQQFTVISKIKMKSIDIHQVDAFTDKLFGGNPAAVVTNADDLTDQEMLLIAREMNLSETAFVSKPSKPGADFSLRWFTPTSEVDFCGHATIGTLYELARHKLYGLGNTGESKVRVETKSGILDMWSTVKEGIITASFSAPKPKMEEYFLQGEAFAKKIGIPENVLTPNTKIMIDTNLNDIYIPVDSKETLDRLKFDFNNIREQFKKEGIVAFGVFTLKHKEFFVRGLAPLVGVDEDPFTGRLQASLVATAKYNKLIDENQNEIISHQGFSMNRPGEAYVTVDNDGNTKVAGEGAHVFSTKITL